MSASGKYQAHSLKQLLVSNNETQAQLYLEKLLLFPDDIQDLIIEDISRLNDCSSDAVAIILGKYAKKSLR